MKIRATWMSICVSFHYLFEGTRHSPLFVLVAALAARGLSMSAPPAGRPLHDGHPAAAMAAAPHHRKGGFRVADILNSPESDHPLAPPTNVSDSRGSFHLPMSEDRTLPPPTFGGHQYPGPLTPGDCGSSVTASSTSGLITPGTISASPSSSNLMMMQGGGHGYHPYASGYLHHLHGSHGDAVTSGRMRKHRSSARSGYTTAPVSVATSPINSRPASPALHPSSHGHHNGASRKMASYANAGGVSPVLLPFHHHAHYHHHHSHHRSGHPHSLPRRSAPSSPRMGASLTTSPFSTNPSHTKHYHHPHPRMHSQRDSHLAISVREAFGMTPIHVPGSQSQLLPEGHLPMDMELDIDPSEHHHHIALPPLKRPRTDDGSIIPSLSALMSRSEPSSRKVSASPRTDDERTEGTMSSPSAFGLELPPLLLNEQQPVDHLPSDESDQKPIALTSSSGPRLPGSRIDLTSLASTNTVS